MYRFILAFIGILLCAGCGHVNMLPDGKYMPAKGEEYIVVKSSTMFFHLRVVDKPKLFINRKYDYMVLRRSGLIIANALTSAEFSQGIGNYSLIWNKKDILVKRIKFKQDKAVNIDPTVPFTGRAFKRVD